MTIEHDFAVHQTLAVGSHHRIALRTAKDIFVKVHGGLAVTDEHMRHELIFTGHRFGPPVSALRYYYAATISNFADLVEHARGIFLFIRRLLMDRLSVFDINAGRQDSFQTRINSRAKATGICRQLPLK